MVGNHVLRLRLRVVVKLNFQPYNRQYTSPNENFEYSYLLIYLLNFFSLFSTLYYKFSCPGCVQLCSMFVAMETITRVFHSK